MEALKKFFSGADLADCGTEEINAIWGTTAEAAGILAHPMQKAVYPHLGDGDRIPVINETEEIKSFASKIRPVIKDDGRSF